MGHLAPKFKNKQINKMGTWPKIGLQFKLNMDYIYILGLLQLQNMGFI